MKRYIRQRGFTAVELFMALVITSMVMGAVAAFSMAMSTAWKAAEKSQSITVKGTQVVARLQSDIRNAKLVGYCRTGSSDGSAAGAAVILWMQDTNGDGYIQGDEVEMIEHDTAAHTLKRYYIGQADAAGTWSYSTTFAAATVIDQFKQNRQSVPIASGVYGAIFQTSGTSGTTRNPAVTFGLKLMVDDSQTATHRATGGEAKLVVDYGAATLRAPLATPGN